MPRDGGRVAAACLGVIVEVLVTVACAPAGFTPPPPNYSTDVVQTASGTTFEYTGQGSCYAAATLFTFGLTMPSGDYLDFSVTMDVGQHPVDGGDNAIWLQGLTIRPGSGSITVNNWNTRDRADGELSATASSFSIHGHWSCRFDDQ